MNSSTLRRLASDHAALHKADLPPHYLFPLTSASSSIPDDLTQLTILLAGPHGTPYSQGVWKLHLKIPCDYPKNPPKASFRTKIWHPNVDESTGSVCVDTLKRDWEPKLTLRDVLITISCLLIQPNPDSALNAAAGQLLQEDYETFARQAKLMTSIHARVPSAWQEAVDIAKRRGEEDKQPLQAQKSAIGLGIVPDLGQQNSRVLNNDATQSADDDDEACESKENDPSLSPSPVTPQSPRKGVLGKRPLSDLPTPIDSDDEESTAFKVTSSERNIANNTPPSSNPTQSHSRRSTKLTERSRSFNCQGSKDEANSYPTITPFEDPEDEDRPTAKRVCFGEGKENATEKAEENKQAKALAPSKPSSTGGIGPLRPEMLRNVSSASHSSSGSGKNARPRVGLRRL